MWRVDGVCGLRKKTDGPGEMASCFQGDVLGFGLPITVEQLAMVNAHRRAKYGQDAFDEANKDAPYFKEDLELTPGTRFLNYGNAVGKDGYWTYEHLARQSDDVLDMYEVLYPKYQIIGEYDWSSGHSKSRDLALNSITMGVKWGGKQADMRDAVNLDDHSLGNADAFMWHSPAKDKWSLTPIARWTKVDCRVRKGQNQTATFTVDADGATPPPPFYDLNANPNSEDVEKIVESVAAGTTFKKPFEDGTYVGTVKTFDSETGWYHISYTDGDEEDLRWAELKPHIGRGTATTSTCKIVTKPGYVGATKGLKQYLWERGLYFERKENGFCKNDKCCKKGMGCPMVGKLDKSDDHHRPHEFSMQHVLGQCRDFANETSALEEKYLQRGMILIMSPKGHPELAGKGIEFSWGVSKKYFRKINNCVGKDLHKNILKSFTVLDLQQSMRNSRRTRRYRDAYDTTRADYESHDCHTSVEKYVAKHKCHRNIMDQETAYIKAVLAKHNIFVE